MDPREASKASNKLFDYLFHRFGTSGLREHYQTYQLFTDRTRDAIHVSRVIRD
jgi:hypothetical protein